MHKIIIIIRMGGKQDLCNVKDGRFFFSTVQAGGGSVNEVGNFIVA